MNRERESSESMIIFLFLFFQCDFCSFLLFLIFSDFDWWKRVKKEKNLKIGSFDAEDASKRTYLPRIIIIISVAIFVKYLKSM